MGAEPIPDSLENSPLAIPFFAANIIALPKKPEEAALKSKAFVIINANAFNKYWRFKNKIIKLPQRKNKAIKGMSFSQIVAIFLIPPIITTPTKTETTIPMIIGEKEKVEVREEEMAFACTILPIPKEEIIVKIQNITAKNLDFSPYSKVYIGPPI